MAAKRKQLPMMVAYAVLSPFWGKNGNQKVFLAPYGEDGKAMAQDVADLLSEENKFKDRYTVQPVRVYGSPEEPPVYGFVQQENVA